MHMELEFIKNGQRYEASFEATSDFNLHLEEAGRVSIYQSGVEGGKYDEVLEARREGHLSNVFDSDFTASVYPKYMKVTTESLPTLAEVNFAE